MAEFTADFILNEPSPLEAGFTLAEPNAINATFTANFTPDKTSQLTNDSGFIADLNYVHTDNNYTTTEKNKLATIAEGAEVNVNADYNATSGDAQILNKPDITAMARFAISETVEGLEYNGVTGVISLTEGYLIPTLTAFNNKVDKEAGKGLSENDFTDADKSKLDSLTPTAGLTYKGAWDASTGNYPTLTPSNGDYWVIDVAGTIATVEYFVGDQIAYSTLNGWERLATGGAQNDEVVHNTGDELIYGNKTFDDTISASNLSGTNTGDQDLSNLATKVELQAVKNLAIAMAVAL